MTRYQTTKFWRSAARCFLGCIAVAVITFVCFQLRLSLPTPTCLYLIVIVLVSLRGSFIPSAIVSIIAAVCLNYYFVLPAFSFDMAPIDYVPLITFLTTSTVITQGVSRVRKAAERLREQTEAELKAQARAMQTERELQAEEALGRSEAYSSEAQRLSHTGSFGWNVSSGDIFWSDETFKIFEYDRAPSASIDMLLQRVHPDDLALVRGMIYPAAQDGSDFDFEHRLLMPDGSVKYVHVVAHAVKDTSGSIEFVGAVMDTTKTRRAEEQSHQAKAELARVARVMTLGELSASIAHEVNQPLAAVVINAAACLRWLDREHPDLDAVRGSMKWIIKDSGRASEVIRRVRALANKADTQRAPLCINDVVTEVIALVQRELSTYRVALRSELAPALPIVLADRVQLQQVIINLVMNGIEAMQPVTDRPRELVIRSQQQEANQILVTVKDSGVGISAEHSDRLFNAFFTTKSSGMGMGLSICRSIIEAHGGQISLGDNAGLGTSFQFTLPSHQEEAS